jgi:restriction endonuclease S subunit
VIVNNKKTFPYISDHFFIKNILQNKLYELQKGSAQPGINKKDIELLEINIPSKEIQEEIVKELDDINEKINQQEKTNTDLKNDIQRVWNYI